MAYARRNDREGWKAVEAETLNLILHEIEGQEKQGTLYEDENFSKALSMSLKGLGLTAAEFARDADSSRSAVSRWVTGQALPSKIVRRTVIDQLKQRVHDRYLKLHQPT